MFTLMKLKLMAALLGTSVSVARHSAVEPGKKLLYGPTGTGEYAVPGEGYIPTRDCTVTAEGMTAEYDGRFITFLDRDGQEEATCQVGERPTLPTPQHLPVVHVHIKVTP